MISTRPLTVTLRVPEGVVTVHGMRLLRDGRHPMDPACEDDWVEFDAMDVDGADVSDWQALGILFEHREDFIDAYQKRRDRSKKRLFAG